LCLAARYYDKSDIWSREAAGLAAWGDQDTAVLSRSTLGSGLLARPPAARRAACDAALALDAFDRGALPRAPNRGSGSQLENRVPNRLRCRVDFGSVREEVP